MPTADSEISVALADSMNAAAAAGNISPTLFYENPSLLPAGYAIPIDHYHGLYQHGGVLVATTFPSACKVLAVPAQTRVFYCWDFEWMRIERKEFHVLNAVYGNPNLTVVTGTKRQQEVFGKVWGRPSAGFCQPDIGLILELAGLLRNPNSGTK